MTTISHTALVLSFCLAPLFFFPETRAQGSDEARNAEDPYWQRLDEIRAPGNYSDEVPTGTFQRFHHITGSDRKFYYTIDVPESYDPEAKTDLHIYLHGGVGISSNRISNVKLRRLKRFKVAGAISVYPSAWSSAKWWYESQTENIVKIINTIKASYNVNENRVFLHGLSDGAAGAYYFASHLPTPFAGFIALVGSPHVLRPKHGVFGTTFAGNLINKPIFAVNTEDDHLFPASSVERLFEALNDSGGNITFHAMPGDHFGMPWLSPLKDNYEDFVTRNTRDPYPDSLFWQLDEKSEFRRIHWLVVNSTAGEDSESAVVARKDGNTIHLSTRNVAAVTLLVSSDDFDLSNNIEIVYNKETVFDQKVRPDVRVLDKWFDLDQDSAMVFASEIYLETPP